MHNSTTPTNDSAERGKLRSFQILPSCYELYLYVQVKNEMSSAEFMSKLKGYLDVAFAFHDDKGWYLCL